MKLTTKSSLVFLLFGVSTANAAFTQLIDFGDSLSDVGNLYHDTASLGATGIPQTPGSPGYYNGRFSNGPVWVEKLAPMLGLVVPTPSSTGGKDFAYGGVTSGLGNTDLLFPNVRKQITTYTASNTPTSSQLFTVLGGANDLFNTLDANAASATQLTVATTAASNITASVQSLYTAGARNILVSNLPDLGLTPAYRGASNQTQATLDTTTFDTALAADLSTLKTVSPGLNLFNLDLETLFYQAIATPGTYGLTDVMDQAYTGDSSFAGNGTAVANPSGYLFWDDVHPTATGHQLIANAAYAAVVPEPGMISPIAIAATCAVRRRRRMQPLRI